MRQGRSDFDERTLQRHVAILDEQARAGCVRVVLVHHPVAARAVGWRRALADAGALRAVLRRAGAELVLHGHARSARLDALPGPLGTRGMIPCLCVPSSSALPNASDEAARWHRLRFVSPGHVEVRVRQWSVAAQRFVDAGGYALCLPQRPAPPDCAVEREPGVSMQLVETAA